jgi:hypothetical protein
VLLSPLFSVFFFFSLQDSRSILHSSLPSILSSDFALFPAFSLSHKSSSSLNLYSLSSFIPSMSTSTYCQMFFFLFHPTSQPFCLVLIYFVCLFFLHFIFLILLLFIFRKYFKNRLKKFSAQHIWRPLSTNSQNIHLVTSEKIFFSH